MEIRAQLRHRLRAERRSLPPRQRAEAGEAAARAIERSGILEQGQRLAAFLPSDGEIETAALIELAWREGKQVYLPVLPPSGPNRLWFRRYLPNSRLVPNRYGIAEPVRAPDSDLAGRHLDLVFAPLVAFDRRGNRLGMGGGYYDRSFAFLRRRTRWRQPRLIGLGYAFQEVDALPAEPWDVPLWGVATERGLLRMTEGVQQ